MTGTNIFPLTISLEALVREIETAANTADGHVIAAAARLRELRRRIEAGEAGSGVKWTEWAPKNIKLSSSRISELIAIADAKDPNNELERLRKLNRERVKKAREKKARAKQMREAERAALINWAKDAPIADVRKYWHQIQHAIEAQQQRLISRAASAKLKDAA